MNIDCMFSKAERKPHKKTRILTKVIRRIDVGDIPRTEPERIREELRKHAPEGYGIAMYGETRDQPKFPDGVGDRG